MPRAVLVLAGLAIFAPGRASAISDPAEMLPDPAQENRAERIGAELRCLVCQNQSIEDSEAGLARDLRRIVRQHVAAGESNAAITAWVVARYGDFVRLQPRFGPATLLLWASPALALLAGGLLAWMDRGRAAPPAPLSTEEAARLGRLDLP